MPRLFFLGPPSPCVQRPRLEAKHLVLPLCPCCGVELYLHSPYAFMKCTATWMAPLYTTKRNASDSKATERLTKQIIYSRSCVIKRKYTQTEFTFKKKKKKSDAKTIWKATALRVEQALCVWDKWELIRQLPLRPLYDFTACLYRDGFCTHCYLYIIYYNTLQVHGNF